MSSTLHFHAINLGPLPVDLINATIGLDLEAGNAWLSKAAHKHMADKHSADYPLCIAHLADAISAPSYIGQDPKQADNFILIKRVQNVEGGLLVAIAIWLNQYGSYNVRTAYRESPDRIERRRQAGHLRVAIPK
jgi:hypothetical protein